jgi:hypothetical protein
MSGPGKLTQKQVDKMIEKAAKTGVADLLVLMDKWRSSRAVAGQALARMLSSPLDQARYLASRSHARAHTPPR